MLYLMSTVVNDVLRWDFGTNGNLQGTADISRLLDKVKGCAT